MKGVQDMIQVTNLDYMYPKTSVKAVKSLNFEIQEGEIFGFLGPSGAGKTTTQRIIIGLLRGYGGNVRIMGKERCEWNNDFYEKVGVAFDFPNLYLKLTAAENLSLIGSYYKNRPNQMDILLERVGLNKERNKKVEGYSKGMKMRLNFIRALLHDPDIYFFDEPTAGLDPVNAKIIKDIILELKKKGKTIFLTTHNMNVADQLCDRVAFIVDGTITLTDSPADLKVQYGKNTIRVEVVNKGEIEVKDFPMDTIRKQEAFFDIMRKSEIRTIHSLEATLEDIFIRVTGKELL